MSFSYQLYSSRNFPPLSNTLKLVGDLGYKEVEGYGALYAVLDDLEGLKAELDANGLRMSTGLFGLDMVENEPQKVLDIAKALAMDGIYVRSSCQTIARTTAAGWRAFGERLEAAGKPIVAAGYDYGYYNHDFEFVETDGVIPMDELLAGGPTLKWEMDVAWVVRGNEDPIKWIEEYSSRISAAHLKDIAAAGRLR